VSQDPLVVGAHAPAFSLVADDGRMVELASLHGRPVVLFFYPEADTPACTKQACGYRDEHAGFVKRGAVVLGVSPDALSTLARFREKFALPYRLLSDSDHGVARAYGAYGEKTLYGRKVVGTIRSSVIVDAEGRIAGVFRSVRTDGNARRMLETLERLAS
jgi:peroxiredoxin Q/BCP